MNIRYPLYEGVYRILTYVSRHKGETVVYQLESKYVINMDDTFCCWFSTESLSLQ